MQGFLVQPLSFTLGTDRGGDKLPCPLLCCGRGFLFLLHFDILCHSFVGNHVVGVTQRLISDLQSFIGAKHDLFNSLLGNIFQGCLQCDAILFTDGCDLPEKKVAPFFSQWSNAPSSNTQIGIGNDFLNIDLIYGPDALAGGTGPLG